MKHVFYFLLILTTIALQAQNPNEVLLGSDKTKTVFYDDGIIARITWYGYDSKVDSLKTYHKSGSLNEVFYHDELGRFLKGNQYNKEGKLLTTWAFKNGVLTNRTDHKLEFNTKNKSGIIKSHAILKKSNETLLKNPNDFNAFYIRANARYRLSNFTLAFKDFKMLERKIDKIIKDKKVTEPNKMQASVYDYLAGIYSSYEMENHTIHYKLKAIKASPNESRLYYNLGAYLTKIGAYKLSISYLNKAIKMVPKHGFAHWLLGIAYTDLGENKKALKNINIAFKHEDGIYKRSIGTAERDLRTTRGLLYHRLGESKKGITDLKGALRINKNNSFALRNLGVIYHDLGQYSKACEALNKAKALAYERVHDKNDLQHYLDNACTNKKPEFIVTELTQQPSVYPNPTKDFVYVKNFEFENFEFEIYNFESKLIKQGISNNKSINFSELPAGLYILKVNADNETHSFKVVKE